MKTCIQTWSTNPKMSQEFYNSCTTKAILVVFYWCSGQWQKPVCPVMGFPEFSCLQSQTWWDAEWDHRESTGWKAIGCSPHSPTPALPLSAPVRGRGIKERKLGFYDKCRTNVNQNTHLGLKTGHFTLNCAELVKETWQMLEPSCVHPIWFLPPFLILLGNLTI